MAQLRAKRPAPSGHRVQYLGPMGGPLLILISTARGEARCLRFSTMASFLLFCHFHPGWNSQSVSGFGTAKFGIMLGFMAVMSGAVA